MNSVVLDASAILALLNQEPGAERLRPEILSDSVASTVNLAEVQAKLVSRGLSGEEAWAYATAAIGRSVEFSAAHARLAGDLAAATRALGLSLGDRACLALAVTMRAPVYTADRAWTKLRLGIKIHCLR